MVSVGEQREGEEEEEEEMGGKREEKRGSQSGQTGLKTIFLLLPFSFVVIHRVTREKRIDDPFGFLPKKIDDVHVDNNNERTNDIVDLLSFLFSLFSLLSTSTCVLVSRTHVFLFAPRRVFSKVQRKKETLEEENVSHIQRQKSKKLIKKNEYEDYLRRS